MRRRRRPMLTAAGGSREWSRTIAWFISQPGNQLCWLRFPGCRIQAETIDHFHTRKHRPDLAEVRSNFRPACIPCNRRRGATPPHRIEALRQQLEARAKIKSSTALRFFE